MRFNRGTILANFTSRPLFNFYIAHMVAPMKEKNRVLIVSDDETVRQGYMRSVDSVFRNAEFVGDGEDAIEAMEQRPFDVVLLDVWKSGFDGLAVLRSIKQKWPESEVVIITGSPTVASAKEAIRLGAYDYVAKPIGPEEVISLTAGAMTQKNWAMHRVQESGSISQGGRAKSNWANGFVGDSSAKSIRGRTKS
jgi:DNA-binding NtrC family response regulator